MPQINVILWLLLYKIQFKFFPMIEKHKLGNIEFVQRQIAKRIHVRILPHGLKVTMPLTCTEQEAMKFINSKEAIILRKQQLMLDKPAINALQIDENTQLQTLTFLVKALRIDRKDIYFKLKDKVLTIEFPIDTDCKSVKVQKIFWNGINYFLKQEAKRVLPERTKQLALKHGFTLSAVKIQSSKSRWGSCSERKSINLSYYLLLTPAHLVDYVILHELCHTIEMNHSHKFWNLMDKVTDNKSDELKKQLKSFQMPHF